MGERVNMVFDENFMHLFDKKTEKAILDRSNPYASKEGDRWIRE